eukprot:UC1_evm1s1557
MASKSASPEKRAKSFVAATSAVTLTIARHVPLANPGVNSLALRYDEKLLASGGWDGQVRLFSWPRFRPLAILSAHRAGISSVVFSAPLDILNGGALLAAASKDHRTSL